jgi:hypothetical protein
MYNRVYYTIKQSFSRLKYRKNQVKQIKQKRSFSTIPPNKSNGNPTGNPNGNPNIIIPAIMLGICYALNKQSQR